MSVTSNVSLGGTRTLTDKFGELGVGLTDRVFIVGHADSDTVALNDPYIVRSLEDALEAFNSTQEQLRESSTVAPPLIRAMLNCYHAGGRDIYLMRAAPLSEYEDYRQRDDSWYTAYYARLETTYGVLSNLEQPMIIVPVGADFESVKTWYNDPEGLSHDFFYQLAQHCLHAPSIVYGLLPARLRWPNYLEDDPRITGDWSEVLTDYDSGGNVWRTRTIDPRMNIGVVYGEGLFNRREIMTSFSFDLCATVAGSVSRMEAHLSPICENLHDVIALTTSLTTEQADSLAASRFITVGPTWQGWRGERGGFMLLNDNTMAVSASDFAHLSVLRLAQKVVEEIRPIAESYIGTPRLVEFRRDLTRVLELLKAQEIYRDYKAEIDTLPGQLHELRVDIALYPYLCHRWIDVSVELGPNRGFEVAY